MIFEPEVSIRVNSEPWHRGVEFLITKREGEKLYSAKIEFSEHEQHCVLPVTGRIGNDDAQTLMDDLWRAGLRPTEGAGSAGALAATQRHLEDMRTLVFKEGKS
jgi:hypothetical protein